MSEHEDIARRLREEGAAQAPPDLADAVMAQVRAEPRQAEPRQAPPRWRPRWRPLLGWAAAAATLTAIGFGIAHLPSGSSSSSSSSSASASAGSTGAPLGPSATATRQASGVEGSRIYTMSQDQLRYALRLYAPEHVKAAAASGKITVLRVPDARFQEVSRRLSRLERAYLASPHGRRLLVRLVRAGTR